jgi:type I restriction enzyme R subunit
LLAVAPTVDSVNALRDENEELAFIKAFRELMRIKNVLATFADFDFAHLEMTEQAFADYKSKYLDLYDKTRTVKEKVSILDDVDFELELIHRDEINVVYILALLANLIGHPDAERRRKEIVDLIAGEAHLRSKRELIEKFIRENMPLVEDADAIPDEFERFWSAEQLAAFKKLCLEENLSDTRVEKVIADYLFSEREPLRDEVLDLIEGEKPTVLQRKTVGERILAKIRGFVETFISGIGGNDC